MVLDARTDASPGPELPRAAAPASASARLWDVDWRAFVPRAVDDAISIELGTTDEAQAFIVEHLPEIFDGASANFLAEKMTSAKRRFFEEMDAFLFRSDERVIGLALGHPTDWSTYYVRTLAVLPEVRQRGLRPAFSEFIFEPLRAAGVERVECHTSPANIIMLRGLLTDGFVITSTENSERWGTMLGLTKFLSSAASTVFDRQFISVPASGRHPQPKRGGTT